MHRFVARIALCTTALLLALDCQAAAQAPTRSAPHSTAPVIVTGHSAQAVRVRVPPKLDGRLDDPAWLKAPVIADFAQHEPHEGEAPTERTEVRMLYDDKAVYFGVWCYDATPSGIVVGEERRDANPKDTDSFLIVLDTYHDRQNGFVFGTTPAGIEYDAQVAQGGGTTDPNASARSRQVAGSGAAFNLNWDGNWKVWTTTDSTGWKAEFRIPFSTLRFGSGNHQTWGLNFSRNIRRRNEEVFWSPVPRPFSVYRLTSTGTLQGVEVPTQRNASVTPYVLASGTRDYTLGTPVAYPVHAGGDAKLGLGSSLRLDLTYNTDFAQVEVDQEQIKLTQYNLFFPEKRPFFLENSGLFAVGSPQAVGMFFSRRIGLGPDGEPIPIVGGGRLTGQVAGLNVGLLNMQTAAVDGVQGSQNYAVARVMRTLPNRSRIGVFFADRDALGTSGNYNRTYAADGRWGIGDAITIEGYAGKTQTPGLTGRDYAYNAQFEYFTRDWKVQTVYTEVGGAFNPEVGFLSRAGYRYVQAQTYHYFRTSELPFVREFQPHVTYRNYFDFAGARLTGMLHMDPTITFSNGSSTSTPLNFTWERPVTPFEISPGIIIPPALYQNWITASHFNTNPAAPISVLADLNWGGFYSGTRHGAALSVTGRRAGALNTVLRYSYDDISLKEGSFIERLIGLQVGYSITPQIFLQSLIQYSTQDRNWSSNLRFGWLTTAGTGLYIVYNDNENVGLNRVTGPLNRSFTIKYTRQFNLLR
jgi:hypothetical protein